MRLAKAEERIGKEESVVQAQEGGRRRTVGGLGLFTSLGFGSESVPKFKPHIEPCQYGLTENPAKSHRLMASSAKTI